MKGRMSTEPDGEKADLPQSAADDPPWLASVERAVLGAMFHRHRCLLQGFEELEPDCFFPEIHQQVYLALGSCYDRDQPIDRALLLSHLEPHSDVLLALLDHLERQEPAYDQFTGWLRDLRERRDRRGLLAQIDKAGKDLRLDMYSAESVRTALLDRLMELQAGGLSQRFQSSWTIVDQLLESLQVGIYPVLRTSGATTGFDGLDRIIRGWRAGGCYLLCSDTYAGSTSLGLQFAMTMADQPTGVVLVSADHDARHLTQRMLAIHTGLSLDEICSDALSPLDTEQLQKAGVWHRHRNLYICDDPFDTIRDLSAVCQDLRRGMEVGLVVVDDMNLIGGYGKEQETAEAVRQLRTMAIDMKCAVIAMGGELARRTERLAVDALMVLEKVSTGEATHRLWVAKHRHGQPGSFYLRMQNESLSFTEVDP